MRIIARATDLSPTSWFWDGFSPPFDWVVDLLAFGQGFFVLDSLDFIASEAAE